MAEDTTVHPIAIPMANPSPAFPSASPSFDEPVRREAEELLRQIDATRFLLARPQRGVR
ncbi:hypothetical protein [Rhodospirillum sp. A1_3_36]|uniref:hypothetical protein n=1 Tax=Rhodospirillum sp. A1_3_36 TaxID=3391666 RepID=UPI0039A6D0C2